MSTAHALHADPGRALCSVHFRECFVVIPAHIPRFDDQVTMSTGGAKVSDPCRSWTRTLWRRTEVSNIVVHAGSLRAGDTYWLDHALGGVRTEKLLMRALSMALLGAGLSRVLLDTQLPMISVWFSNRI